MKPGRELDAVTEARALGFEIGNDYTQLAAGSQVLVYNSYMDCLVFGVCDRYIDPQTSAAYWIIKAAGYETHDPKFYPITGTCSEEVQKLAVDECTLRRDKVINEQIDYHQKKIDSLKSQQK